jgi:hypothetical protein
VQLPWLIIFANKLLMMMMMMNFQDEIKNLVEKTTLTSPFFTGFLKSFLLCSSQPIGGGGGGGVFTYNACYTTNPKFKKNPLPHIQKTLI